MINKIYLSRVDCLTTKHEEEGGKASRGLLLCSDGEGDVIKHGIPGGAVLSHQLAQSSLHSLVRPFVKAVGLWMIG